MGIGSDLGRTLRQITHFFYCFPKRVNSSRQLKLVLLQKSAECNYTCHPQCRDKVKLDCNSNGKSMESSSVPDVEPDNHNKQPLNEKERETSYLSKDDLQQKLELYNSAAGNFRMTLNPNGTTYTGFIKVQIELKRPITVETSGSHERNNNTETAFYTPKGSANILHISSIHTVREVIEALLRKFTVVDNPAKFALYKKRQKDDQVYTCKLSDGEHPLLLRLLAGPDTNVLSFVLREQQTGEVMWDSFSVPELQNFIQILNREEEEHLQLLKRRYATYRQKLEEALQGQRTPG
ncbi:ras association domain-containing protein 3 isoform X2 [Polypterus senegalus]|uniref:ras association domain-containing protein 3 isoform X2 n=1 Tax=Polypterus senegalus TaxID=55291 RepID=UPI001964D537|nr:ras association domain-containing protein 3 isoform X2 [Polypterus senegalus]